MENAISLAVPHCAEFEDFRPHPYPDPASALANASASQSWGTVPARKILAKLPAATAKLPGAPWTIGYGQTGADVTPDTPPQTEAEARAVLEKRVANLVAEVRRRARADGRRKEATEGQVAAMAAFLDNVGGGRRKTATDRGRDGLFMLRTGRPSTLWGLFVAGDDAGAAAQFGKWNKAGGVVLRGLTRRRAAERAMFVRVG